MSEINYDELIAAYALGALSEDEQAEAERAMANDAALARAFDEYLVVAAELGGSVEPEDPSPQLWDRIQADIRPAPVQRRSVWSRAMVFVSATAVALVAVLGIGLFLQRSELADLRDDPLSVAVDEARDAGGTIVVAMTGEVTAEVVLGEDGTGYLVPGDLPALSDDSTYQLWAIVDERVISAGVLGADPGIAPFHLDTGAPVNGFALTVEVAGGVVSSDQAAVSVGLTSA